MTNYSDYRINQGLRAVYKAANYTARPTEAIMVDSSIGPITITLPASPQTGAYVQILDAGNNAAVENITVGRNGETIDGAAEDFIIDENNGVVDFIYNGTTWKFALNFPGAGLTEAQVVDVTSGRKIERFYPEAGLQQAAAGNPAISYQTLGDTNVLVYDMVNSGFPVAAAKWKPPENWDEGTCRARVWWTPSNTNTGNCVFQLNSVHATDGNVLPAKIFEVTMTDAASGAVDSIQSSPWSSAFTIGTATINDFIVFEIFRNADSAPDTFTGTAYLLVLEIEYQTNAPTED